MRDQSNRLNVIRDRESLVIGDKFSRSRVNGYIVARNRLSPSMEMEVSWGSDASDNGYLGWRSTTAYVKVLSSVTGADGGSSFVPCVEIKYRRTSGIRLRSGENILQSGPFATAFTARSST